VERIWFQGGHKSTEQSTLNVDQDINVNTSLQQLFTESNGKPVVVGNAIVKQSDTVPMMKGKVTIRFVGGDLSDQGLRLKAKRGWIELSDGSRAEVVDTWRDPDRPDEISYEVSCPSGCLMLWNIYRLIHASGVITEDMWTGNAGMVMTSGGPNRRTYACSPGGKSEFNPNGLIVELEWQVH